MRIAIDKVSSSTRNVPIHRHVVLGSEIPARHGTVIAVRVLEEKAVYNQIEDPHGRMMTVHKGDVVVGVLGERRALKGYSGVVPDRIQVGDEVNLLNLGGVIGKVTSFNPEVGPPARCEVLGAVLQFPDMDRRVGAPASIYPGTVAFADKLGRMPPTVWMAGTCMHAGKTAAACSLVRSFTDRGLKVGVAKVTGVALRRDSLEMLDHGAVIATTFADAGLASTCAGDVVPAARGCLNAVAASGVDVMVVELGDGILGDYGVMDILNTPDIRESIDALVLAANDSVGAWGGARLLDAAGLAVTAVTGPATDNEAGCRQIRDHAGVAAINARKQADLLAAKVLEQLGMGNLSITNHRGGLALAGRGK